MRAALVASCLRGALPPVDLRAVCFVRAMVDGGGVGGEVGRGRKEKEVWSCRGALGEREESRAETSGRLVSPARGDGPGRRWLADA